MFTQIQTVNRNNEKILLCSFLLNCHHKQDAVTLIINSDESLVGGILCDGVSESPASGIFSKYIVNAVKLRLETLNISKFTNEFNSKYLEQLLSEIIQDFYSTHGTQLNPNEVLPKSTFILYLSYNAPNGIQNVFHHFFYLGDGKIAIWDDQTNLMPSELLLEYHNETGVLLNALRKDLSAYTKQYPISKITLTTAYKPSQTESVLFASDGLEPYYEDFLFLIQNHPEIWEIIQNEQEDRLQEFLLNGLFGSLKIIPNDDVSLILIVRK